MFRQAQHERREYNMFSFPVRPEPVEGNERKINFIVEDIYSVIFYQDEHVLYVNLPIFSVDIAFITAAFQMLLFSIIKCGFCVFIGSSIVLDALGNVIV